MTIRCASLGSISTGTLRTEDLLDAFSSELDRLLKRQPRSFARAPHRALVRQAQAADAAEAEFASELVDDLIDALQEYAPPYCYFGAHPGDGADFGFWVDLDAAQNFDGMRVNDTSEVPLSYSGEVLHINDHGNVSLYTANRGRLKEVWSIV